MEFATYNGNYMGKKGAVDSKSRFCLRLTS